MSIDFIYSFFQIMNSIEICVLCFCAFKRPCLKQCLIRINPAVVLPMHAETTTTKMNVGKDIFLAVIRLTSVGGITCDSPSGPFIMGVVLPCHRHVRHASYESGPTYLHMYNQPHTS